MRSSSGFFPGESADVCHCLMDADTEAEVLAEVFEMAAMKAPETVENNPI